MKVNSKNSLIVSCAIVLLIIGASPLPAYVLQGRHVLDLVIEKLGRANTLFVSEKLIVYRMPGAVGEQDPATEKEPVAPLNTAADDIPAVQKLEAHQEAPAMETREFEGTLRYVFERAFRSDAKSPDSEQIHISTAVGRTLTIIDGNIVPETFSRFNLFKDILLYRSREAFAERLLQLGIDVSISSLGRFEDKIAFVLGANYPDESVNQVWIDKETLLPLRLIIRGIAGADHSDKVEIRYLIWWKIDETQYPSRIEFYQDGDLVRVSQAKNFEVDATFSEDLFNIDRLKTVYPRAPLNPITNEPAEEPSEIQKTIEEFKRIFE
jgi:hypothetical protein